MSYFSGKLRDLSGAERNHGMESWHSETRDIPERKNLFDYSPHVQHERHYFSRNQGSFFIYLLEHPWMGMILLAFVACRLSIGVLLHTSNDGS